MSLPEKLKLLLNGADADELSYSERLWPYPFDAHDVPDFGNLNSWVDDSLEDEDLKFHIENSINCIRALQLLLEESGVEYQEPTNAVKTSFERVLELMKSIPIGESKSDNVEQPEFEYHGAPQQFFLYSTKSKMPVLVDGTKRYFYNFDPPMVLLVNEGKESEAKEEETIFRGVPASFSEDYPVNQMDSDQILVGLKDGRRIVLHLSLNYPVSSEQLDDAVGSVPDSEQEKVRVGVSAVLQGIPLMPADGAGIGPSEEMAEIVALERERIAERTQTLAAFADFNFEKFIERAPATEVPKVIEVGLEYFKSFQNLFPGVWEPSVMAASTDDETYKSFKIKLTEVNLTMRVASDPDGVTCCLSLFNEEGEREENLSDIEIFDETQKLLSSFIQGYAEIPTKYFNDSKMLIFNIDGQEIRIALPRI